jgi:hypothetical protein
MVNLLCRLCPDLYGSRIMINHRADDISLRFSVYQANRNIDYLDQPIMVVDLTMPDSDIAKSIVTENKRIIASLEESRMFL